MFQRVDSKTSGAKEVTNITLFRNFNICFSIKISIKWHFSHINNIKQN